MCKHEASGTPKNGHKRNEVILAEQEEEDVQGEEIIQVVPSKLILHDRKPVKVSARSQMFWVLRE